MAVKVGVWISLMREFTADDLDSAESLGYNYIKALGALGPFTQFESSLDITSMDLTSGNQIIESEGDDDGEGELGIEDPVENARRYIENTWPCGHDKWKGEDICSGLDCQDGDEESA